MMVGYMKTKFVPKKISPFDAYPFFGNENLFTDAKAIRFHQESFDRLVVRFISEREGPVVHRDECLRAKIGKRPNSLFRVHVDIAPTRRLVGADRHQRDVDLVAFTDFLEPVKIGTVATMEDTFPCRSNNVSAVITMGVVNEACAPVMGGSVDDFQFIEGERVPDFHLMDGGKSQALDEGTTTHRNHDPLACLKNFQAGFVKVIKVGVGH